MPLTPDQLPDDIAELKRRLIETTAQLGAKDAELSAKTAELAAAKNGLIVTELTIEKLKAQIARLKREKFASSSERIERAIEQLELALEEAEAAKAEAIAAAPASPAQDEPVTEAAAPQRKKRRQLPPEFPRRDVVHRPPGVCKTCGGSQLRDVSETVTEVLAYVPARFEVIRHVRPACSCQKCETMVQAPMPELPIPRGMVDASFLAHIIIAKFCDHLPLYRQAEIYARSGLDIDRSQLAEWLGHVAWLLRPLVELIAAHVMAGRVIHADDTPVDVLAPGTGKTKTGRLWVYLRDERSHGSATPPAVLYRYTPDRKGEHCRAELANFTGWLHADGYAGFGRLYEIAGARSANAHLVQGPPRVAEVGCWSHVRRGFFDEWSEHNSALAKEALDRIGVLFDIERPIAGSPPDIRRAVRQRAARPRIDELAVWLAAQLAKIPGKSDLAAAIHYARSRWTALTRYLDDGRLEISNNAAENKIRPAALGRKNWLFCGSDAGGERAASFYTLAGTARLNGVEPEAWLTDVIARIG
ncbi:MAG TPA: IS66 family transposase, partial [Methyloceanibacter sp.]|nr:IS66 family transposase [Methyloceanibacter sp.]